MDDLSLLHHWTVSTYAGFGDKTGDELTWQVDVPQMATKYPYIMHGVLAMSALHLAYLQPERSREYLAMSVEHQDVGLAVYRDYMINQSDINYDNVHSVIAYGAFTIAYAFAWPDRDQPLVEPSPHWRGLMNWAILLRGPGGLGDIMSEKRDWLLQGPMAYQVRPDIPVDEGHYEVPLSPIAELEFIIDDSNPNVETLRKVYNLLNEAFHKSRPGTGCIGYKISVYRWVSAVPNEYLTLLCQFDPVAMVLLAHICVLIKLASRSSWYMDGAAERTLKVVEELLPLDMRHWMNWPKELIANEEVMNFCLGS
ncbi:hypothetical protein FH972_025846 [Carpinus fangiana]|uniref:Uncharacterized protein n=1 Tax=Carpinus fangiana TaxID=176857 RepID=A0A5N6L272_9ROSI|nr:hypothetical protein FH972_025846 [Carpinus fangiana]